MQGVDYELLLRQRDWLIALCDEIDRAGGDCEMADGLINLCDYLLDGGSVAVVVPAGLIGWRSPPHPM